MLTFLRRVRKSLVTDGLNRRYLIYTLGEILLVMIGILLALQINNWNEDRKEREVEQKLLIDLADQLLEDSVHLSRVVKRFELTAERLPIWNPKWIWMPHMKRTCPKP